MSNWSNWEAAAFRGASVGVDEWRLEAELVGVQIIGGLALAAPGVLRSSIAFDGTIRAFMMQAQAPPKVADAVSSAIWKAWKQWADGVMIPGLPWYPAFFAWPSPVAPPMPNVPSPLALCVSSGLSAMNGASLGAAIRSGMGSAGDTPDARAGITHLADSFSAAFTMWYSGALVTMVFGTGTAPVALPWMPVAPVVQGTLVNNGRGCLAAAQPFPGTSPLPRLP